MNTLFSPLSFLFKMQIGWIVNIMTVITPSCREIRSIVMKLKQVKLLQKSSKNEFTSHLSWVSSTVILHWRHYLPQIIQTIPSQALSPCAACSPSVYFAVLFLLHHHLSMRSSDAKRPFQHQTLKVELSSDTRSYFFVANRLSSGGS